MEKELISIVVPAYNIEKYIGRCLDSILSQTYSNIEIIVVNDGSSDKTKEIIDEYASADKRIIAIHKDNGGVSSARLRGIQESKGDYIGFVDGDDVIDADMFEFLLNNLKGYSADISHCGYVMEFPDGHKDYYYNTEKKVVQNNYEGVFDLLTGKFVEPGLVNKLYKKEIILYFQKNKIWDGGIRYNEDVLMNYILFSKANKSIYEDKCKYHYVLRKGSAATSKPNKRKYEDPMKVVQTIYIYEKRKELSELAYRRYIRCLMNCCVQNDYVDLKKESKKQLRIELSNQKYHLSKKEKVMSYGIVYVEPIYMIVRKLYDYLTGNYKKYRV